MGRSKDRFLEETGGFRLGESQEDFARRVEEIRRLEASLKTPFVKPDRREEVMRRICELKGIDFDSDD